MQEAQKAAFEFASALEATQAWSDWQRDLDACLPPERWRMARDWVRAFSQTRMPEAQGWVDEAATVLCLSLPRHRVNADLQARVEGLLSEHPRMQQGALMLNLNDFWQRFLHHHQQFVGVYRLGNIIRSSGFNTFFPVAFHGFCGQREDGQGAEFGHPADFAPRER